MNIDKVYFIESIFGPLGPHTLSERSCGSALLCTVSYSQPFNEMFIFNGKYCFCNSTFTDVHFTLLLAKNI